MAHFGAGHPGVPMIGPPLGLTGVRFWPPRGARTSPPGAFATIDGIQGVYLVLFIDVIMVRVRDEQVTQSVDLCSHWGDRQRRMLSSGI